MGYFQLAFANFILIVFLVLALLFFVVLVLLLRQIKKNGSLPPERMPTLVAVLFIPSILIFALISKGITGWRADIQKQQEYAEINQFVASVYQPLAAAQVNLLHTFNQRQAKLKAAQNLEQEYPNHADVITDIIQQWGVGQKALLDAYKETDKEVRRAWISFNTMDQQDVLAKFAKQAVHLETNINKADKNYQQRLISVQDSLVKNMDRARKLLDANRKPPRSKKQKQRNRELAEKIQPFNDRAAAKLVDFLGLIDKRLAKEVTSLQQLIRIAGQQEAIIRRHLQKNQDLEKPLTIIINKWKALEAVSLKNLNQILYAAEAEYIALSLGLSQKSPAITAMHKSLRVNIPFIVGKAEKQRKAIDQSYTIKE